MPNENLAFKKNNRFALKIFRESSPNKKIQNYSEEDQRKIINFLNKYVDKNTPEAIKNWSKNNPNKNFHTLNNANKSRIIRETKEAIQRWSKNYPSRNFYALEDGYKKRIIRETKSKIKRELNASNAKTASNIKPPTSKNLSSVRMLMSGYKNNAESAFLNYIIKSLKHSMHPNKYPKPRNNSNTTISEVNKKKLIEIRKILNSKNRTISNNTKYNKIKNMF